MKIENRASLSNRVRSVSALRNNLLFVRETWEVLRIYCCQAEWSSTFISTHSRPQSHFHYVTCWNLAREKATKVWDLIGFSENYYSAEVEQFSLRKIILSKYVDSTQMQCFFIILVCKNCKKSIQLLNLVPRVCRHTLGTRLETTTSFLSHPFPCIPGPMNDARGRCIG